MTDELSDIPRHFIEEFKKAGPEYIGWQMRTGGLTGPRLTYAGRWLAHLEVAQKQARRRYDRRMFALAVATAVLAFIAAVEGGLQLAMTAHTPPRRAASHSPLPHRIDKARQEQNIAKTPHQTGGI
jgi:hypothetical protein